MALRCRFFLVGIAGTCGSPLEAPESEGHVLADPASPLEPLLSVRRKNLRLVSDVSARLGQVLDSEVMPFLLQRLNGES